MNILQIISRQHNRSGSGVQMMQLSLELAKRGHKVTAAYRYDPTRDDDFEPYRNSPVSLLRLPYTTTRLRVKSLIDIFMVRRLIKQGNFDVIHTHSNVVDHVFLGTLGMDIPIVSNRGMSAKLNWAKGFKYRSDKIKRAIAVSKDIKDIMMKTGGIDSHKIDVVYGSVDPDRFSPELSKKAQQADGDEANVEAVTRSQLNIPKDAFVYGYTGSIGGRKGINFLLDAFAKVLKEKADNLPYLLLVGFSEEQLRKSGIELDPEVAKNVVCAGFQHQPEYHMALFDTFVFPGVRDEGLTGAIREAVSMKIPAISTDNGGNRELVIDQETGLMVPIRDSHALANAMKFMMDHPEERDSMVSKAYQIVMDSMTIEKRTDAIEALYRELVG
ncbi:MAG: glycosyltransferase family 4 protein [Arenicella sp.]